MPRGSEPCGSRLPHLSCQLMSKKAEGPSRCVLFTMVPRMAHPPAHPLTHPLTHSLTRSLVHLLTHSPTHPLRHSLTHPLTHSGTHSLRHSPTHSHTHSDTHPLTHSLTHLLRHSLRHPPTHPRTHSSAWYADGTTCETRRPTPHVLVQKLGMGNLPCGFTRAVLALVLRHEGWQEAVRHAKPQGKLL